MSDLRARLPLASSDRGEGPYIWRFSRFERTLHLLVVVSFFGLVVTGVPLRFATEPWAHGIIRLHGGVHVAGMIHGICAMILLGYFFVHVGSILLRVLKGPDRKRFFWGPNSMVPQPRDVRDVAATFRWFFGRGPRPRFDRFSYLEKFDYWSVFWGVAIIGGSGLLLWFPEAFARVLPGWIFNVATVVHGEEALLALCFIFVVHFFNGQLRPEKFPLDVVIFTGRATAQYMDEEHPDEMDRLRREGVLERRIAPAPPRWLYLGAAIFGVAAMAIGLSLAVLVVWALLK